MAWEWVSPVAVAVSGSIGIWATFKTGREGRKHAENVAKQNAEHTERMAHLERQQQRFADAYVELLTMLQNSGQWAWMVRPLAETDPPQLLHPLPSPSEQARVTALVRAYGSDEVKDLLREYTDTIRAILRVDADIAMAIQMRKDGFGDPGFPYIDRWRELDGTLRPGELAKREALEKQVAAELNQPLANRPSRV